MLFSGCFSRGGACRCRSLEFQQAGHGLIGFSQSQT
jgi:hypothetical protein